MKREGRWKRLLWGGAVAVTLAALFYAEEDWRGARELKRCLDDLRSRGEPLSGAELFPNRTEEGDLSKTEPFADWFSPDVEKGIESRNRFRMKKGLGNFAEGKECDLAGWWELFRSEPKRWSLPSTEESPARNILAATEAAQVELGKMQRALARENAYWPLDYGKGMASALPQLSGLMNIARIRNVRGQAFLADGRPERAREEFLAILDMADSLESCPNVVSYLYESTLWHTDLTLLWQGLRHHAWREGDLVEIEARLARKSMLRSFVLAERGELVSALGTGRLLKGAKGGEIFGAFQGLSEAPFRLAPGLFGGRPAGWVDLDMSGVIAKHERLIREAERFERQGDRAFLETIEDWAVREGKESAWRHAPRFVYAPFTTSGWDQIATVGGKAIQEETYVRLARVACFLEIERLRLGHYPDRLDAIGHLPPGLDREVLTPDAFAYRREGDGYHLYSVGWNRQDDGGKRGKGFSEGDWVWSGP